MRYVYLEANAMKLRTAFIITLVWVGLLTCGCPRSGKGPVLLPGDIAGSWKARGNSWKIVLGEDGSVVSAVIDMGGVEVRPKKITKVEMKDGQFSTYKAGECIVEYAPAERELYVSVEMEKIHVVFMDNVIDGNSIDRFAGPVSENGKVWTTEWIKTFDYGPRFPQGPEDIYGEPLVFDKIPD
jgi:hypothetical protein